MSAPEFALLGATPTFPQFVPLGQRYFPSWERYQEAFRGIFDRQYYTEYGPLNQQLERKLEEFLGVKHAICVTNETVGMMMVASALELTGKVILSPLASDSAVASLRWTGLDPVYCNLNPETLQVDASQLEELIDDDVSAIMGMHAFGGACDVKTLAQVAESRGLRLYFDASHAFGCTVNGKYVGNFGIAEVFSFHQDNILSATEGGCICTNDDDLAASLRTMRSSAGAGRPVVVTKTVNGRMTEAQSAIALMNLEDHLEHKEHNENLYRIYQSRLAPIFGLQLIEPFGTGQTSYQSTVCAVNESEFGLTCEMIVRVLQAENVGARRISNRLPSTRKSTGKTDAQHEPKFENEDSTFDSYLQLPIGATTSEKDVALVCQILDKAQNANERVLKYFG
jgi:dTDP-4-amino-4,6-dideoxygalactose transaminase